MTSGLSPKPNTQSVSLEASLTTASRGSIFGTIPPERLGLNGEYDHSGLAKRVALAFSQEFSSEETASLRITQRGRVVVLIGKVSSKRLLNRMVAVALRVDGAADVETFGVGFEANRSYTTESDCFNRSFYAC